MPQSQNRIVIVGAGHAAGQLSESLRKEGHEGGILVLGEEPYYPYQRPPLSKAYMAGELADDRLLFRPNAFYEKNDVEVRTGSQVEAIDTNSKQVSLQSGECIQYDKLAITTGTRVRKLPLPGVELKGVHYLRTIDDIKKIREGLETSQNVVIIGAGFIGLEAAAVIRKMEKNVTVLEVQDRVLPRVVAPQVSTFYRSTHESRGVDVRTDVAIKEIAGENGEISGVVFEDGSSLEADLLIIGIGVIPNTDLAAAAGIACDNGITVDEYARTSVTDIVAAGDCANHYSPLLDRCIRLESVHNAVEQAKTAAATLCGNDKPYAQIPWFWSDQYEFKLQIVGLSQGYDLAIMRGEPENGDFSVFYFKEGKFLAVDSVNNPAVHMVSRKLLAQSISPSSEEAADPNFNLKSLL